MPAGPRRERSPAPVHERSGCARPRRGIRSRARRCAEAHVRACQSMLGVKPPRYPTLCVSADPMVPVSSRSESAGFSSTSLSCVFFTEVLIQPSSCPRSWLFVRGRTAARRPSVQPESPIVWIVAKPWPRDIFKPADLMHVRNGAHTLGGVRQRDRVSTGERLRSQRDHVSPAACADATTGARRLDFVSVSERRVRPESQGGHATGGGSQQQQADDAAARGQGARIGRARRAWGASACPTRPHC
jgi:hypothetical protein